MYIFMRVWLKPVYKIVFIVRQCGTRAECTILCGNTISPGLHKHAAVQFRICKHMYIAVCPLQLVQKFWETAAQLSQHAVPAGEQAAGLQCCASW